MNFNFTEKPLGRGNPYIHTKMHFFNLVCKNKKNVAIIKNYHACIKNNS